MAAEERLGGGRGGRHGGLVRLRARGLQPPLGPGQRPAPPRRHPLLLGQVRIAAQQVGYSVNLTWSLLPWSKYILRSDMEFALVVALLGVLAHFLTS